MSLSPAHLLTLVAAASSATAAAYQGFNYGANIGNVPKSQQDFETEFKVAANLPGTNQAFKSARIYTMRQGETDQPIAAIPAAIKTNTTLLLGLWASAGQERAQSETAALSNIAKQYCPQIGSLVAGISVGSEDVYRDSPIGRKNSENPGASPDTVVTYVKMVRNALKGTCLADAPVGHVDTWTAFANESSAGLIDSLDWLGMDEYPYFEDNNPDIPNSIDDADGLFHKAYKIVQEKAKGKPVWITEMGWPVSGKQRALAVASPENAQRHWRETACPLFGDVNTWYFTLQEDTTNPEASFAILGTNINGKPKFDLSCNKTSTSKTSSSATPRKTSMSSHSSSGSGSGSGNGPGSGNGSGSGSGSDSGSGSIIPGGSGSNANLFGGSRPTGQVPESSLPQASGNQLNSFGGAAVAILLALAVL